jgi:methylmalonyl-CoA mutase N-terminal domain/subunit
LQAYQEKKEILIGVNEYIQETPDIAPTPKSSPKGDFPVLTPFNIEQSLQKSTI